MREVHGTPAASITPPGRTPRRHVDETCPRRIPCRPRAACGATTSSAIPCAPGPGAWPSCPPSASSWAHPRGGRHHLAGGLILGGILEATGRDQALVVGAALREGRVIDWLESSAFGVWGQTAARRSAKATASARRTGGAGRRRGKARPPSGGGPAPARRR